VPAAALIDSTTLAALIGSPEIALLDCRFDLAAPEAGRRAYLAGHIPGAHHADLNRDLSSPPTPASGRHPLPDPERLSAWLRGLGIGLDRRVIVYDEANAAFAARAWWLLRWLGASDVSVLDGGFKAWVQSGGAIEVGETQPPAPPPAPPAASAARAAASASALGDAASAGSTAGAAVKSLAGADAVVDAPEVMRALGGARALLVDARAPERFAGTVEPIDPVAGHVPGAVNHPFQSNLRPDGRFLPPQELAHLWRERLAGRDPADIIMMCGSGVTACQNLLALEIAGLPGAKLYAGSWSEWIRDPRRPIARGA
jgi:thiosulfate/3-mercaptopyruvate sulfurtransferase